MNISTVCRAFGAGIVAAILALCIGCTSAKQDVSQKPEPEVVTEVVHIDRGLLDGWTYSSALSHRDAVFVLPALEKEGAVKATAKHKSPDIFITLIREGEKQFFTLSFGNQTQSVPFNDDDWVLDKTIEKVILDMAIARLEERREDVEAELQNPIYQQRLEEGGYGVKSLPEDWSNRETPDPWLPGYRS